MNRLFHSQAFLSSCACFPWLGNVLALESTSQLGNKPQFRLKRSRIGNVSFTGLFVSLSSPIDEKCV